LQCTSQYMHVCQILAAMERDEELDETMLLAALLHDLGKVSMLAGEAPDHVVCFTEPIEGREPGCGLGEVLFQFGHDEIAYSRFKDHVPEHVAWMLRYHSMILRSAEPYMDSRDREYEEKYLSTFRTYDQGTKSPAFLPAKANLDRYRDLIEEWFPNPILF
ncbi:MAG: inositol oxygenase family protein, partial [Bryobacterales bacterium]